jgi:hypothetical protein
MGAATPENPLSGTQIEPKCRMEAVLVRKSLRGWRHALLIKILLATCTVEIITERLEKQSAVPRVAKLRQSYVKSVCYEIFTEIGVGDRKLVIRPYPAADRHYRGNAMEWIVRLECRDKSRVLRERDVARFERQRDVLSPEEVGLSLLEEKALLHNIQSNLVRDQTASQAVAGRTCQLCGRSRRIKDCRERILHPQALRKIALLL